MGSAQTQQTSRKVEQPTAANEDTESVARKLYDYFNAHDLDGGAKLVADDCEWIDVPSGMIFRGPAGYKDFDGGWIAAFPDAKVEVLNVIAAGDHVATEFIGRGTHDGPYITSSGETIEPTGKTCEVRCVEIFRVRGGKIVRARMFYDALSVLRQLGVWEK
jgi:steroid delta-isomerase-like uncharacterized protein